MELDDLTKLTKEDVLGLVGLASRRSTAERVLAGLGYLAAGLVIGVGAALMLAPKSGRGLREDIGKRLRRSTGDESSVEAGQAPTGMSSEARP